MKDFNEEHSSIFLLFNTSMLTLTHWIWADVGNSFSGGGFSSGGSSSSSESDPLTTIILLIIFIIVGWILYVIKVKRDKKVREEILSKDPEFSSGELNEFIKETFIQVQEAWEDRDMSSVQTRQSEELFNRHQQQLQEFIQKEWFPHLDNQIVNGVYFHSLEEEGDYQFLIVRLEAYVKDYTTDRHNNLVQGTRAKTEDRIYRLTFKRHRSVLSDPKGEDNLIVTVCPNCGAPTVVGEVGKCEFCGNIVRIGKHDWVLDNYEAWN